MYDEADSYLNDFRRVAVIGAGSTGRSVGKLLGKLGKKVLVSDNQGIDSETRKELEAEEVEWEENGHSLNILGADLIIVSPGVPLDIPILDKGKDAGIPILGEIELGYRLCKTEKIIAVTGTNGKTTTVRLITEILKYIGKSALSCGNIGNPFTGVCLDFSPSDIAVVEVSSYQLQTIETFKPQVGVLLNLDSDHLPRHGSFDNYKQTKLRLFENQGQTDCAVVNRLLDLDIPNNRVKKVSFSGDQVKGYGLKPHNRENLAAALQAVRCVLEKKQTEQLKEIPDTVINRAIGVPHRLEFIGERAGITFVNDSKATNPSATAAAINSYQAPVYLLMGGRAKRAGYRELADLIKGSSVRSVFLFGEAKDQLAAALTESDVRGYKKFKDMEEAMKSAFHQAPHGAILLLSPACSSFDAFNNFEERGEKFKGLFHQLTDKQC